MEGIFALFVALLLAVVYFYNRLVKFRNYVRDAWAGIEVQLTKRHDLVPLLVQTVKTYSAHETNLLEQADVFQGVAVHDGQIGRIAEIL